MDTAGATACDAQCSAPRSWLSFGTPTLDAVRQDDDDDKEDEDVRPKRCRTHRSYPCVCAEPMSCLMDLPYELLCAICERLSTHLPSLAAMSAASRACRDACARPMLRERMLHHPQYHAPLSAWQFAARYARGADGGAYDVPEDNDEGEGGDDDDDATVQHRDGAGRRKRRRLTSHGADVATPTCQPLWSPTPLPAPDGYDAYRSVSSDWDGLLQPIAVTPIVLDTAREWPAVGVCGAAVGADAKERAVAARGQRCAILGAHPQPAVWRVVLPSGFARMVQELTHYGTETAAVGAGFMVLYGSCRARARPAIAPAALAARPVIRAVHAAAPSTPSWSCSRAGPSAVPTHDRVADGPFHAQRDRRTIGADGGGGGGGGPRARATAPPRCDESPPSRLASAAVYAPPTVGLRVPLWPHAVPDHVVRYWMNRLNPGMRWPKRRAPV